MGEHWEGFIRRKRFSQVYVTISYRAWCSKHTCIAYVNSSFTPTGRKWRISTTSPLDSHTKNSAISLTNSPNRMGRCTLRNAVSIAHCKCHECFANKSAVKMIPDPKCTMQESNFHKKNVTMRCTWRLLLMDSHLEKPFIQWWRAWNECALHHLN